MRWQWQRLVEWRRTRRNPPVSPEALERLDAWTHLGWTTGASRVVVGQEEDKA